MVKPITKETLFMNCMELDFATKIELEHWIATFEEKVWTKDVMEELSKAGLVRTTAAQVWNKDNHRITRIFEYEDEKAFHTCRHSKTSDYGTQQLDRKKPVKPLRFQFIKVIETSLPIETSIHQ